MHDLIGHSDTIRSLCFLNDRTLISGSDDGTIRVWDVEKGKEVPTPEKIYLGPVTSITVVPKKYIVAACDSDLVKFIVNNI